MATRLKRSSNSTIITVDTNVPMRTTRDGSFYSMSSSPRLLAKIYRHNANDLIPKLVAMLDNPPEDSTTAQGHVSIAWPVDLLYTPDMRDCAGILTLRPTATRPLSVVYNPITRRRECPLFNYRYMVRAARNLAGAIAALHRKGYVIGDINDQNALVADTALVTLIDTDLYQVFDPKERKVYRCLSGRPEYSAPELQGLSFADIDREPTQDCFALAVLVYQLLMEGTHPFSDGGVSGEMDGYKERIHSGTSVFAKSTVAQKPSSSLLPVSFLPPAISGLFARCFVDAHSASQMRPNADEWASALQEMESRMLACSVNPQHLYSSHLAECPWCERMARYATVDPFPSREVIEFEQVGKRDATQEALPSAATSSASGGGFASSPRPGKTAVAERPSSAVIMPKAAPIPAVHVSPVVISRRGPNITFVGIAVVAALLVLVVVVGFVMHSRTVSTINTPTFATIYNASTGSVSSQAQPVVDSVDAVQSAAKARQMLDTVTITIAENQNRTLSANDVSALRAKLINDCQSAQIECDKALRFDPKCVDAWQQRIRAFKLVGESSKADKAVHSAKMIFASDPAAMAQISSS